MKMIKTLIAAAVTFAAMPAFAENDVAVLPSAESTFVQWGEESGWTIYVDKSRNSCLIERVDENENVVQMGLTEIQSIGYLGVFTKADIELKEGEDSVVVAFDDAIFVGTAQTLTKHLARGYKGGYILTDDPGFVDLVQRKYEMVVFPDEPFSIVIGLDGSMKAIDAARDCYAEANS